ncbi:MAG TPA: AtpZ/AtpI family protein [Firmicutes bacterium]|nr:AtpZ/AtpI family protein [Bacillota bacterium]
MKDSWKYIALITQIGLTIAFTIFLFTILGVYLDRLLNTKVVFTLIFLLVGCFGGIWTAYQRLTKTTPKNSGKNNV